MRRIVTSALIAGSLVLGGGLALAQHQGSRANHAGHVGTAPPAVPAKDTREPVGFPPQLAEHTLANMRDHLLALQEINVALSHGHNGMAAKIAEERLGMSAMRLHGAHEVAKYMPQGMQEAGSAMHRAASRFAIEAQNSAVTGDLKPAFGALSEVMGACVACHAGYRLK